MITATLATIPGREQELCLTVRSLLPQCDRVNVVSHKDEWLRGENSCKACNDDPARPRWERAPESAPGGEVKDEN